MLVNRSFIGLLLGPALFLGILLLPLPEGMTAAGLSVAAVAALMAAWWISEAIPIPATALLPIALFPVLGVMDGGDVTRSYAHHLIYLFLGGFLIAVTMQKWNLHHRIALHTIRLDNLPIRFAAAFLFVINVNNGIVPGERVRTNRERKPSGVVPTVHRIICL